MPLMGSAWYVLGLAFGGSADETAARSPPRSASLRQPLSLRASLAGATVASDRGVAQDVDRLPASARAVRAVWFGGARGRRRAPGGRSIGAPVPLWSCARRRADRRRARPGEHGRREVRRARGRRRARASCSWSGRLPRPCTAERCESCGSAAPSPSNVLGLRVVQAGRRPRARACSATSSRRSTTCWPTPRSPWRSATHRSTTGRRPRRSSSRRASTGSSRRPCSPARTARTPGFRGSAAARPGSAQIDQLVDRADTARAALEAESASWSLTVPAWWSLRGRARRGRGPPVAARRRGGCCAARRIRRPRRRSPATRPRRRAAASSGTAPVAGAPDGGLRARCWSASGSTRRVDRRRRRRWHRGRGLGRSRRRRAARELSCRPVGSSASRPPSAAAVIAVTVSLQPGRSRRVGALDLAAIVALLVLGILLSGAVDGDDLAEGGAGAATLLVAPGPVARCRQLLLARPFPAVGRLAARRKRKERSPGRRLARPPARAAGSPPRSLALAVALLAGLAEATARPWRPASATRPAFAVPTDVVVAKTCARSSLSSRRADPAVRRDPCIEAVRPVPPHRDAGNRVGLGRDGARRRARRHPCGAAVARRLGRLARDGLRDDPARRAHRSPWADPSRHGAHSRRSGLLGYRGIVEPGTGELQPLEPGPPPPIARPCSRAPAAGRARPWLVGLS